MSSSMLPFELSVVGNCDFKKVMEKEIFYIDDPIFHEQDAEKKIFEDVEIIPDPPHWTDYIDKISFEKKTKTRKGKAILKGDQEKILFRQFNYARFKVAEIKKQMGSNINSPEEAPGEAAKRETEIVQWFETALLLRAKIVEYNLRLIISMIKKFSAQHLDLDELYSEGQDILLAAIDKFDHSKAKFSTYAYWSLVRAFGHLNKERSKRGQAIAGSIEDYEESYGAIKKEDDSAFCIESLNEILEKNLANLSDEEKRVIYFRYLDNEKRPSVADTSLALDIKKHKVSKHENSAFQKIKKALEKELVG